MELPGGRRTRKNPAGFLNMTWTKADTDWWSGSERAWVRRVRLQDGSIRFVGWRVMQPVLFWFETLEAACIAVERQPK